ncbi:Mitochondrial protein-like, related [Neospora caninum Liverpool]|uniref:Mitochondrial protein-like, related n=1 Tax=Neospora caninum (strain Liverpool) TaxID=572307 RepID=F0VE88_NEOCL|nr:Mitochondrial protein-like, related [Neospora caninum Liverpool]CBZ52032.1 Mitochondrial protein-like, related [Neospora caninum Liverpool]CEL65993.1 TPA: Mitochondrial protein-like, related [Neospora caninum Liverpool]|eukprot:XP_003882064.1 Mitochondrial protein-like, related [Neospora caninum Liverpool]
MAGASTALPLSLLSRDAQRLPQSPSSPTASDLHSLSSASSRLPEGPEGASQPKPWPLCCMPLFLTENPLFNAGFGLAVLGTGAALARRSWQGLQAVARRQLLTSLEIPVRDPAYPWVMQWLVSRGSLAHHLGISTEYCKDNAGNVQAVFNYIPSPGRHVMRYKNAPLVIERTRSGETMDFQTGTPWETLTLQTFAFQRHIIQEILEEARRNALAKEEGKTVIFRSVASEWRKYGEPKTVRPFDSVVLADGVAEQVYADVLSFLKSSQWYLQRGIPYRRGYLLHGPPGCGKSSFVMALAGKLKYNICVMNVGDPLMTDDRLQYLLATVPPQSILLLEDIDGAIQRSESALGGNSAEDRKGANPYGMRGVTFSGLLNALDGIVATEERVTIMTTNHPERLPDSLIRPGRVDIKVRVGYATRPQLRRQFLRFFPGEQAAADKFEEILSGIQLSMAELQGFFLFCKDNVDQALAMAESWKKADDEARAAVMREREADKSKARAELENLVVQQNSAHTGGATSGNDQSDLRQKPSAS